MSDKKQRSLLSSMQFLVTFTKFRFCGKPKNIHRKQYAANINDEVCSTCPQSEPQETFSTMQTDCQYAISQLHGYNTLKK